MSAPAITPAQRRASNVLLAVGYPLAWGAGAKLLPTLCERRTKRFVVLETGTAMVTAGLAVRRRRAVAALNGFFFLAFGAVWLLRGRRD